MATMRCYKLLRIHNVLTIQNITEHYGTLPPKKPNIAYISTC